MSEPTPLAGLQAWLQQAILTPPAEAPLAIRSTEWLPAPERLAIYARGYRMRLVECLRGEFKILFQLLGEAVFDWLALAYIEARPSQAYTLYRFGAGFADFLAAAASRPEMAAQAAVPAALARIERAMTEVHLAPGPERATAPADGVPGFLAQIIGFARPERLIRPATLRLLALPFDFTATLAAAERQEPPPLPAAQPSWLAVARTKYRIRCHRLERWQFDWLAGLPADPGDLPPAITRWLPAAFTAGLVSRGNGQA